LSWRSPAVYKFIHIEREREKILLINDTCLSKFSKHKTQQQQKAKFNIHLLCCKQELAQPRTDMLIEQKNVCLEQFVLVFFLLFCN
jgi:hypothetical protein